jgi:hypothetical protein
MYTISRDEKGISLICPQCLHSECVNDFSKQRGSQRTQAAQAMLRHERAQHAMTLVLVPIRTIAIEER